MPALSIVSEDIIDDDFSDIIGDDVDLLGVDSDNDDDFGIDLDDALLDLKKEVQDAVDFVQSNMMPDWERAEAFFDGDTDVKKEAGRSQVTDTVVRDTIRALKPSAMRVFVQADTIVAYEPADGLNYQAGVIAQQQSLFANQLFWANNGYLVLSGAVHNAFLKKIGIMKAYYKKTASDEYATMDNLLPDEVEQVRATENVVITSEEVDEVSGLVSIEAAQRTFGGRLCVDDVPLFEFFWNDSATGPDDASVIGQRRNTTVSDARAMGLEHDDWRSLSSLDVEMDQSAGESEIRRGYSKTDDDTAHTSDESQHKFLLTEAYMRFDLDGTGIAQLYRFWLGGIDYQYIDHERVKDNPYSVGQIDPMPNAFAGRSIFDILEEDQNSGTSLLRATFDNAHAANNVRMAYHETMVNSSDVNAKALNHPIRFRQPGMIQPISVPSNLGEMLPLLQHLEMKGQTKAGATNAAMGLDPDALQSTDKAAVQNTIQLAQGQIELMVRNFAETGMRPLFDKLLRLSLEYNPKEQVIQMSGKYVPVDQSSFTPDLTMKTTVGIGMPDVNMKMAGLDRISQKQEQVIAEYGMSNPLCGMPHLFNTYTDMANLSGIPSLGRYFSELTPEATQQMDQISQQKAEAARTEKPSEGIAAAETIRAQARIREQELENENSTQETDRQTRIRMLEIMTDDDFARDKMAQDLAIEEAKLSGQSIDKAFVVHEQGMKREHAMQMFMAKQAADREAFVAQQEEMQRNMANTQQQQGQPQPPQGGPQQ